MSLLVKISNVVLRTQYIPTVRKHTRAISILKPGKDPALPSSYRLICLLDTICKLFENIPLSRILSKRATRILGSGPNSASFQLARRVESVTRNFGEKRPSGAVFLDVAKAFDTVWVDGLL